MNEEIERIIEGLKDGSITISKVANKYRKDPLVQQTYLEIKNNKEIERAIKVIEKNWDLVYCLRNATEEVISSPRVIKAALEHNKYSSYQFVADNFYRQKQKNIELEYDKFVINNAELYKDVPETIYELIRCGYDIATDSFFLIERRKRHSFCLDEEDASEYVSFKFVNDDKELNRYQSDRLLVFNDFEELMEYVSIRNYDIYLCSNFDDYNFSNDLIKKYEINIDSLLNDNLFSNSDFTSFNTFIRKFKQKNKLHFYQKWYDREYKLYKIEIDGETKICGEPVSETLEFHTFCEYSRFLKGNLSNADLTFSFELERLKSIDTTWMNFDGAKLTSKVRNSLGLTNASYRCKDLVLLNGKEENLFPEYNALANIDTDLVSVQNEERRLVEKEYEQVTFENNDGKTAVFYYFSDLHLADRFNILRRKGECIVPEDEIVIMQEIVNSIVGLIKEDSRRKHRGFQLFLLINGDTSRDYRLFEMFVKMLKNEFYRSVGSFMTTIVFTFGNRELYGFSKVDKEKARQLIEDNGMFLLENEILYIDEDKLGEVISYNEFQKLKKDINELKETFETARIIILGGTGFKVENDYYPSAESDKFEEMYNEIIKLHHPHTIVMSHYPPIKNQLKDKKASYYCEYRELYPNVIYFHGHTHNDYYYNDGLIAVYADNQLYADERKGKITPISIKKFFLDNSFDLFDDEKYGDGIHKITADDYRLYMCGKNISMQLRRETGQIYLLKKYGYNCFVEKTGNKISIMNGGRSKRITEAYSVEYIYERMDKVVNVINDAYSYLDLKLQYLSKAIKAIGGSGKIHGCIVDIDWFNHVYLNPNDNTITAYYAENVKNKTVYPNIAALLESECKSLYVRMQSLIDNGSEKSNELSSEKSIFYLSSGCDVPVHYESTDMYSNSYKIQKMQKLKDGILTTWLDIYDDIKQIDDKSILLEFNDKQ